MLEIGSNITMRFERVAAAFESDEVARVILCKSSGREHSLESSTDLSDLIFITHVNFLGDSDQVHKPHLVGWDFVCLPKMNKELGFKCLHLMNEAFLMKMLSNLTIKPDDLWCRVLR
ncbi:DUF506 family protein, partial [Trifolium medium]|nr:DUF506 family protein [Trifolium medium]